jgi:acyl-CoA synthetase (AMP-forming)/AMP-acid ligase II
MGLVGHVFVPLLLGAHQHLLSPRAFIRDPASWLRCIGEVGATQTTAPNFAFSMCAGRIEDPARLGVDLGSLRQVLNGAELVQLTTLRAFGEAFAPLGFRPEVFRPVYGLAECTLAATISPPGGPRVDWVDRQHLAERGEARPMARRASGARSFVGVGPAVEGHELKLVDHQGRRCPPRHEGEILLRGPSVMRGYFNNPQATQQVFAEGGWLRTGDLGYMADGQLFVTGRRKELIIKAGRNYLPEDFEAACQPLPQLRPGRAVAFGVPNPVTGTEDLVLVAEVRDPGLAGNPLLRERVAQAVTRRTGLRPDRLELIVPGVLPKTSSGKLQRTKVRAAFEAGEPLQAPRPSLARAVKGSVRSAAGLLQARVRRLLGWQ